MKGKNSKEVATEKLKPFEVMDAQSFDSGTFVFPATEQPEIPYIVLLDFHGRTIRFSTPQS